MLDKLGKGKLKGVFYDKDSKAIKTLMEEMSKEFPDVKGLSTFQIAEMGEDTYIIKVRTTSWSDDLKATIIREIRSHVYFDNCERNYYRSPKGRTQKIPEAILNIPSYEALRELRKILIAFAEAK